MTESEIMKALECCFVNTNCNGCPQVGKSDCLASACINAFDLLNRKNAEIELLENESKRQATKAIKEFVERCKKKAFLPLGTWFAQRVVTEDNIDEIAKEMGVEL